MDAAVQVKEDRLRIAAEAAVDKLLSEELPASFMKRFDTLDARLIRLACLMAFTEGFRSGVNALASDVSGGRIGASI